MRLTNPCKCRPYAKRLLEVDDILLSPLTPLVLAHTVPQPVCEMQTPALFTMARYSPQPQSVDTANYGRVNPLPSFPTSSSSAGELHLYIDSDTSSPSIAIGQAISSQNLGLLQTSYSPSLNSTVHTVSVSQLPPQQTSIPSWADEVDQSGHSTPETVVPNWPYSDRIRGPRPRSQPLVYPPPVMPTPHTHTHTHKHTHTQRPPVPSPQYGPTTPPLRPQ